MTIIKHGQAMFTGGPTFHEENILEIVTVKFLF